MHFPNMLVIANQCRSTGVAPSGDSLRSQSVFQAFPSDEGGSRVPRKRKTDEGLASPYGRGAEGEEGDIFPLSHFVTAPPEWEPRGKRIATSGAPPRNDMCYTMVLKITPMVIP